MNKKLIRWAIWTVASPFILFLLLGILIYLPPIQNALVDKATLFASEAMGMQIKVGRISLSFPLNLVVTEVEAIDKADTLLQLNRLQLNVEVLPLFKQRVEIDGISVQQAKINSANFIPGMQISGNVGQLFIRSRGVELGTEQATINKVLLKDSKINLCITDTVPKDTTKSSTLFWKLKLKQIEVDSVSFAMQMPTDSLSLDLYLGKAELNDGFIDLHEAAYSLKHFLIKDGEVRMDQGKSIAEVNTTPPPTFDPAHIHLKQIQIELDSLYYKERDMHALIRQFSMQEKSGLNLVSMAGKLTSNEKVIRVSGLKAEMPASYIEFDASLDWEVLDGGKDGWITARLMADIGKSDAVHFMT
ncbi:MAG: translocation/assembly module TamB domain-containing protein, partial [Phocaeicola sp.]